MTFGLVTNPRTVGLEPTAGEPTGFQPVVASVGFAARPDADETDAIVLVVLPMPKSLVAQETGWSGEGPQRVLAAPHFRLDRYAVVSEADPHHTAFVRLIREAQTRKSDQQTTARELEDALGVVRVAVTTGRQPDHWGAAFPQADGDDAVDTSEGDDPFGF